MTLDRGGLRPSAASSVRKWIALERRDLIRDAGVVTDARVYSQGRGGGYSRRLVPRLHSREVP